MDGRSDMTITQAEKAAGITEFDKARCAAWRTAERAIIEAAKEVCQDLAIEETDELLARERALTHVHHIIRRELRTPQEGPGA